MEKTLFKDYSSKGGLTVGTLKKILEDYPDDLIITKELGSEFFPVHVVSEGTYELYPIGCNGVAQGKAQCLRIR